MTDLENVLLNACRVAWTAATEPCPSADMKAEMERVQGVLRSGS
jgi:hypothetical protein